MLPSMACRISSSLGSWFCFSRSAAAMIIPGVQKPHWRPCFSQNAFWSGWSAPSPAAMPSIVVTLDPSACAASIVQLLTALPSTWTVHAPHWLVSHPTCVPVRPSSSLITWTRSRLGSTSTSLLSPLTSSATCSSPTRETSFAPSSGGAATCRSGVRGVRVAPGVDRARGDWIVPPWRRACNRVSRGGHRARRTSGRGRRRRRFGGSEGCSMVRGSRPSATACSSGSVAR